MERFAIIGFGCAGYHALRAIREAGCDAAVDVYSDTDLPPYNPMLTTYYTAGRLPYEGLFPFGTLDEISAQYKPTSSPTPAWLPWTLLPKRSPPRTARRHLMIRSW